MADGTKVPSGRDPQLCTRLLVMAHTQPMAQRSDRVPLTMDWPGRRAGNAAYTWVGGNVSRRFAGHSALGPARLSGPARVPRVEYRGFCAADCAGLPGRASQWEEPAGEGNRPGR